ncbi:hypothetical protein FDG2_4190 [Candidatus Protofrankia californiensis]|uniref:Uncharacterized protein n=1 Tax=Candidatus Protofrankia californiensis TaxID=1839754 RepID=A0A1C3P3X1_9ACTN|nr:hypothetical protein FDG2_4190 [Candidatus Protofrankia californiensis]
MADIDPAFLDERVATLDDKLTGLLAEIEAVCVTWAIGLVDQVGNPPKPEEK